MDPEDSAAFAAPVVLRTGADLGRYTLKGLLGQGAMAAVWRAHDPKLGRDVAIKILSPAFAVREEAAERFRREARAVAAIAHPGIVQVYDFVPSEDGAPAYLVQELIEGTTIEKLAESRGGKLPPEIAVLIASQVADALAAAHARGVIHRDVKPENVMIERAGTGARVVLTDFGVAHVSGLESMTATGAMVGSPAYMAPEQARGHDVEAPADVWAIGVMLYRLATGQYPFPGRDAFQVIASIARGTYARPSQLEARVGPGLEAVIARCLKQPLAERYSDAVALARDLREEMRAVGLEDASPVLRKYLDDGNALETELAPTVARVACARARAHLGRREVARALAEIGRATAWAPGNAEAEALLASLSSRKRRNKLLVSAGATVALAALAGLGLHLRSRWQEPTAPAPAIAAAPTPTPTDPTPPPAPAAAPVAQPAPVPAPSVREIRSAPRRRSRGAIPAAVAEAPVPVPTPAPAPPVPEPPPPVPAASPPAPAASESTAKVKLMSAMGFCYPRLEGQRPQNSTTPLFRAVKPGSYKVYCAPSLDGPAEEAGTLEVPPSGGTIVKRIEPRDGDPRRPVLVP